jgi:hypothetical protein
MIWARRGWREDTIRGIYAQMAVRVILGSLEAHPLMQINPGRHTGGAM